MGLGDGARGWGRGWGWGLSFGAGLLKMREKGTDGGSRASEFRRLISPISGAAIARMAHALIYESSHGCGGSGRTPTRTCAPARVGASREIRFGLARLSSSSAAPENKQIAARQSGLIPLIEWTSNRRATLLSPLPRETTRPFYWPIKVRERG
jgi:hypothetical protein